ncbi:MAG TPA: pilus assembly protein N-terminal domain-containing protein [Rhizomicrobium sp.]|nr:pilus assembly protein N-terminal domain-containing protein [Rhizomicrobium sp.]
MRRTAIAATFVLSAVIMPALAGPSAAGRGEVNLALDEVHTLTFRGPVATVYVGNPTIADITMVDARHAFVQGKGYGRTNIVALNQDGVQVFGTHVTVTGNENGGTVVLNRGAQRITLNCAGQRCEPTPMPGDGKDAYEPSDGVTAAHQSAARMAAANAAK